MWLQTTDHPSRILHDGAILRYADPSDGQYIFWLKDSLKPPTITNTAKTKRVAKPANIELWHSRMGHLSYRSLKTLKDLSTGIDFKETASKELCGDCQKGNQTHQLSKTPMSQSTEFLDQVHSDLEGPFLRTRQGYRYYIFFLEESTGLIDVEPLKYKDDVLAAFKNYKALREKKSGCQLKVFHTDGGENIWKSLITILKKMVSLIRLLPATHLSRMEKPKESIILLWVLFGLSLLNKNFQSHYGQRLQKL